MCVYDLNKKRRKMPIWDGMNYSVRWPHLLVHCLLLISVCGLVVGQQRWDRPDPYRRGNYDPNYRPPDYDPYSRPISVGGGTSEPIIDSRCSEGVKNRIRSSSQGEYPSDAVVNTPTGTTIQGRYAYLCDRPGIPEWERPRQQNYRPFGYDYNYADIIHANLTVFLGIPYAKPPTKENDLRFKPPATPDFQHHIYATKYRPGCSQNIRHYGYSKGIPEVHEDCLYLNVFSPYVRGPLSPKYPVMVYIHGGFYDHGSANVFPAHMLAASQSVVVVTFNYRLGPFGFLATADRESPGNYGIMDQALAIQWVYDNIAAFNGDNRRITLFGPDAGGASATLLAISPQLRELGISRVIAQSGSAEADWALIKDPAYMVNTSRKYAESMGCTSSNSWKIVECLKTRGSGEMVIRDIKPDVGWLPWGPVIDVPDLDESLKYIPTSLETYLKDRANRLSRSFVYLTGLTRDEGSYLLRDDEELKRRNYEIGQQTFLDKIKKYMKIYNYTLNEEAIFNAIKFMYSPWEDMTNRTLLRQGYINLLTDSYFTAGNDKIVKLLLEKSITTFMYVLNYSLEGIPEQVRPKWMGVPHDEEYFLVTGAPFMDPGLYPPMYELNKARWTEADRNMSQFFMESWANFAKHGNPTPYQLFNTIKWEPMHMTNLQYLPVNSTNMTSIMLTNYRQKESQFWNDYLPSMINKEPPTWPPATEEPWVQEKRTYKAVFFTVVGIAALFLILTVVCCILYCRAKSKHIVDDDQIPVPTSASVSSISSYGSRHGCITKYVPEKAPKPKKIKKDTAV